MARKFEDILENFINEKKKYKITKSCEVEDNKIDNKFYNVTKGEKVELVDDDGEIAIIKLKSGEVVRIESDNVEE